MAETTKCFRPEKPELLHLLFPRHDSTFFAVSPQKTGVWNAPRVPLLQFLGWGFLRNPPRLRDFRFNPGCMGEQQFYEVKLRPAPCAPTVFALCATYY
jgi:hypothetical protein